MLNHERESVTQVDLKSFSLPREMRIQRSELPDHVLRVDDMSKAVNSILTPAYNGAIIGDQARYSAEFLKALAMVQLEIDGKGEKYGSIPGSISQLLKENKKAISPSFDREIAHMTATIGELVALISQVATSVSFKIYNGTHRPTHFHDDKQMIVALRTLSGPGTIFVDNSDALPNRSGQPHVKSGTKSFCVANDELLIFRGGMPVDDFREGFVHKAPDYRGPDRIFLSVFGRLDASKLEEI